MESSKPKPIVDDATPSDVIRDIVVDSDPRGAGIGWANSIGFEETPEGFQDNIRIVYGLNESGKTSMMRTIHELFRGGVRGKHVLLDRIAGDFRMVEEIPGRSKAELAGKTLLGEVEKELGRKPRIRDVIDHPALGEGPVANRLRALLGNHLLTLEIDRFPEESRDALRRIGDGSHSWAYHYDRGGDYLETSTVERLKELLREHDLPQGGVKADLIKRLQDYDCVVLPREKKGDPSYVKEYLFIDRGAITKKVTRKFTRWNPVEGIEKPNGIEVTVLGRSILPGEVFESPLESAKAFGRLYREAVPYSELPDTVRRIPQMKVSEMQDELKRLSLPYTGSKGKLAERLYDGLRKEAWNQTTGRVEKDGRNSYDVWNRWEILEETCFPGLDYEQTAELFADVLPWSQDDKRDIEEKISSFTALLELTDDDLTSMHKDIDVESLRTKLRTSLEEFGDQRQAQIENLQNVLSMISSVSPMKFEFCHNEFVSKNTQLTSTYEERRPLWGVNGFRILTDWWHLSTDPDSEYSQKMEFQNRQMTRFRTVFLDCDRVAIDRKSGVVGRGGGRESAAGLEREIRDFWEAYPPYERVGVYFQNVRDVLDDALREMHRRKKKKFDVYFPPPNEYEEGSYLGSNLRNLWHLDLDAVEDKLQSQLFHIRRIMDEQIGPGLAIPNVQDPDLYLHTVDEERANSFVMVNAIAAVIEPALNILRLGKDFTGLTFHANETYPEFVNFRPRYGWSTDSEGVPHDRMSSGQKHLFTMILPIATASLETAKAEVWPEMKKEDHILVLIDEPEISLHVNWQEDLVQAVGVALRKNDGSLSCPVSVVFATHSPSLLGNHLHRSSCLGPTGGDYVE